MSQRPQVIYVDHKAAGTTEDGNSWQTAFKDLQKALAVAERADDIWIAQGDYVPGPNSKDTFHLNKGIRLFGGFVGGESGEIVRDDRDWEKHVTTLSGGGVCYHVVTITGFGILDGFTITGGNAASQDFPDDVGGGLYCDGSVTGTPGLHNLIFSDNKAAYGGAMYSNGKEGECSPTLTNVTFSDNIAQHRGGAMYNNGNVGGESSPTLTNVTFSGNSAEWGGGAMYNDGLKGGESSPTLRNVTFSDNSADRGGAMYNNGNVGGESSPTLTNVTFSGNSAEWGGAMNNFGSGGGESNPMLSDVTFSNNSAHMGGGAMYNYGRRGESSPTLTNVTFSGNRSEESAGAMWNDGKNGGKSSPTLSNVTFSGNSAVWCGVIRNEGARDGKSSPTLTNVILWGNSAIQAGQVVNTSASTTISYSIIQGGAKSISGATDGGQNQDADPHFVEPQSNPNRYPATLRLRDDSPALKTGKDGVDIGDLNTHLFRGDWRELTGSSCADVPAPAKGHVMIRFINSKGRNIYLYEQDSEFNIIRPGVEVEDRGVYDVQTSKKTSWVVYSYPFSFGDDPSGNFENHLKNYEATTAETQCVEVK